MKSIRVRQVLVVIGIILSFSVYAQEGMWIPSLLEANEAEMQAMGFELNAADVYSINQGSMKDAVLQFGGGCTGEVISDKGLVLTNHHCGFGSINSLSSVENNYLRDGYWAQNMSEELPAPGLKVMFIVRIEEVTDAVLSGIPSTSDRQQIIQQRSDSLAAAAVNGSHYGSFVRDFYYGNQYFLFVTETFTDIRLVGTPPRSVGEFGGETDNWVWPRHTGDFSMWRIYADADNLPAEYSEDNKPFIPRYHFPVSIDGVKEGDFTLVFGFPGRTQEYLPSAAVEAIIRDSNPAKVALREKRIRTMESYMHDNDTLTLMYASKTKGLANAYKKWQGESQGLIANNAIEKKQQFEAAFNQWCTTEQGKPYAGVTDSLNALYTSLSDYTSLLDHTIEGALGIEAIRYARNFRTLAELLAEEKPDTEKVKAEIEKLRTGIDGYFNNYYAPIDHDIFPLLMQQVKQKVGAELLPPYFLEQVERYKGDYDTWSDALWNSSALVSASGTNAMLDAIDKGDMKALSSDPMFQLYNAFLQQYLLINDSKVKPLEESIQNQMQLFMAGIMASGLKPRVFPDANSTLRVSYGTVQSYYPRNGVEYLTSTTHKGILEKYKAGDEEFDVPGELLSLLQAGDFGAYADASGELPVGFIASNHTTGGNSGSPVLNAKGELVGINFDRVWEGTMSDIMYDINRCRNISVDIRYVLFIVDYLGNADWVVQEIIQ